MFIRAVRGSGRWFPEWGCILEHQIFRFAAMILCDRCSTLDRWSGKIAERTGMRPSALLTLHFWRKSRRIVSFLMLSTYNFENWGSLAELFRFWCCLLRKLRKSPRIVSFLILSSSKIEKASQNCFALDLVKFNSLGFAELFCFWCCQVQKLRKFRRIVLGPAPPKLEYILYIFNNIY